MKGLAAKGSTSAHTVSRMPSRCNSPYSGTSSSSAGIASITRKKGSSRAPSRMA
ncbi:hypothetical protein Mterra_02783 [Calidithermus terrae]|uniref:Uncharacterized protein n=1 Tax=Calidithermus terrae TaxID=1408545 RepID=A0A399EDZ8_9DEIN|nr:hypothetical protein Mterra_02783 [Calidithermus terrae]